MKIGKATGPDDVPAEAWKLFGHNGSLTLSNLYNRVIRNNKISSEWTSSITEAIWKRKGDVVEYFNHLPVRLTFQAMKIFERISDSLLR